LCIDQLSRLKSPQGHREHRPLHNFELEEHGSRMKRAVVLVRDLLNLLWATLRALFGKTNTALDAAPDDDSSLVLRILNERVAQTRGRTVKVTILTPIRMFGDGLAACFGNRSDISVVAIVNDLAKLRETLEANDTHVVLIDVTQGIDLFDVRPIAAQFVDIPLLALGLNEQRQEVISCGRQGFAGYIPRDASIDAVCKSLCDAAAGRLTCPPEISSGLLRALFRKEPPQEDSIADVALTRRESEVLELVGRGLSNKEIGNELCLSVATVKHHVHHLLEKLKLQKRAQAMRRVQDAPWIAHRLSSRHRKAG
jgi:DNA-binding NarL/FixJ family response regulator